MTQHTPRWITIPLALIFAIAAGVWLISDRSGQPFCHKQIGSEFNSWAESNGGSPEKRIGTFPNVGGRSEDSLAKILDGFGPHVTWGTDYRYVPGLKQDDPGQLVLMYFNRPTRWISHVEINTTIFREKNWIIVPVDFKWYGDRTEAGPGEWSEWVVEEEFKQRLQETLDYLKSNQRPNWETIVAEHAAFLESLDNRD